MAVLTMTSGAGVARFLRAIAMCLMAWFVFEFFRPGWDGDGNPMWLVFIAALGLTAAAKRLSSEKEEEGEALGASGC